MIEGLRSGSGARLKSACDLVGYHCTVDSLVKIGVAVSVANLNGVLWFVGVFAFVTRFARSSRNLSINIYICT